ncbi:MAG: hypothetical protein K9M36_00405 [Candidatus Pacebacteria bacterium]|nr:hypothetical protein [Candidatus Paceibacterota bacterium]
MKSLTPSIKEITLHLPCSQLRDFFFEHPKMNIDYFEGYRFLNDAFLGNKNSPEEKATYFWHKNIISENSIGGFVPAVDKKLIDLTTRAGCIEARKRLNFLKLEIQNQTNGISHNLLDDGNGNFIGRFRLKNRSVFYIFCFYSASTGLWGLAGWFFLGKRSTNYQFLSDENKIFE